MKQFNGESENSIVYEALHESIMDAINKAKESLETDMVEWHLEKISGTQGGFTERRSMQVTLSVKSYQGK